METLVNSCKIQIFTPENADLAVSKTDINAPHSQETAVKEAFVMIRIANGRLSFMEQLSAVKAAMEACVSGNLPLESDPSEAALQPEKPCNIRAAFIRCFLSDAANQEAAAREQLNTGCPLSIVEQKPVDGTKIALFLWLADKESVTFMPSAADQELLEEQGKKPSAADQEPADIAMVSHGSWRQIFATVPWKRSTAGSYGQTMDAFSTMLQELGGFRETADAPHAAADCQQAATDAPHATLERNCLRTWFFVRDIDRHYMGMVKARNEVFKEHSLTRDTHFIASTGIGGATADSDQLVKLDYLALTGVRPEQIRYLYAKANLNSTADYGVAFERGTLLTTPQRRYAYISGTASIDHQGRILHEGDVRRQSERVVENVRALLKEAGAGLHDIAMATVYLRDFADREAVESIVSKHLENAPCVFVLAPVCRPKWLVEMECVAVF